MTVDESQQPELADHLGPLSYLAVEFPDGKVGGEGLARLRELVERGAVLVIDLEFVARSADGGLSTVPVATLGADLDLTGLEGTDAGLLDREDVDRVAGDLAAGAVLAVLVYEVLVMEPVLAAWAGAGARLLAEGPVDAEDLEQALDATTAD